MEILSYLQEKGIPGQILHGNIKELALQLRIVSRIHSTKEKLQGFRLGVTEASDWLIASNIDTNLLKKKSGMEMIELSMEELCAQINKRVSEVQVTEELARSSVSAPELEKALHVYGGLRRIVDKYRLQGYVKCFDLLEPYQTSGCLALAIPQRTGIHAACEEIKESSVDECAGRALGAVLYGKPCQARPGAEKSCWLTAYFHSTCPTSTSL